MVGDEGIGGRSGRWVSLVGIRVGDGGCVIC